MGVAIDMDSYGVSCDPLEDVYGEEVMYSGWNPAVTLLCQQQLMVPTNRLAAPPEAEDFAAEDEEPLLQLDSWGDRGYTH
jgi:hypothetical protein